jgi:recombinational DNA repair ATPase RecF
MLLQLDISVKSLPMVLDRPRLRPKRTIVLVGPNGSGKSNIYHATSRSWTARGTNPKTDHRVTLHGSVGKQAGAYLWH